LPNSSQDGAHSRQLAQGWNRSGSQVKSPGVRQLSREIERDFAGQDLVVVAILNGR
jgi:hypothetical protein